MGGEGRGDQKKRGTEGGVKEQQRNEKSLFFLHKEKTKVKPGRERRPQTKKNYNHLEHKGKSRKFRKNYLRPRFHPGDVWRKLGTNAALTSRPSS